MLHLLQIPLVGEQSTVAEEVIDSAATAPTPLIDSTGAINVEHLISTISTLSGEELLSRVINGALSLGSKLLLAIVIYLVGRWIIRYLRHIAQRIMQHRSVDGSLNTFVSSLLSIALNFILLITIIGIIGIDTTSFVALFASAGLAIGMALSGTLQNFAGGVMILAFKPYKVGEFIEAQGQTGTVKEIQLFNTVLNTLDNKMILIPNGGISTGIINNYSREAQRRVDWTFGVSYGTEYTVVRDTILELLKADERILTDPEPFVALHSLGDSSVNVVVRVWVDSAEYWNVYFEMNEKVYNTFNERGISFPFPQMDVHLFPNESTPA